MKIGFVIRSILIIEVEGSGRGEKGGRDNMWWDWGRRRRRREYIAVVATATAGEELRWGWRRRTVVVQP